MQGANELHLYNWNNYIAEETVKRFEAYCKCRLVQDYYSDNEELLAKLAAGATGYDVLVPTGNAVETLIAQRRAARARQGAAAEPQEHQAGIHRPWYDPGNNYSVPYAYSITLIGYNVEKMKRARAADRHLGGDLRARSTWRRSKARSPCSTASASCSPRR